MKLMTKEIQRKLSPLYANEDIEPENVPVAVKFFNPTGVGTWYITEWDGADLMFGLCCIHEPEFGYVSLSELQSIRLPYGLSIERDLYWKGTLADAMRIERYKTSPRPMIRLVIDNTR